MDLTAEHRGVIRWYNDFSWHAWIEVGNPRPTVECFYGTINITEASILGQRQTWIQQAGLHYAVYFSQIFYLGPHFLCGISGVVQFTMWLISSWEENKCCYKLSKCTKWHLFQKQWSKLSFWVKIVVILSVAQLVTTVVFFSAWDKSRVKWNNSRNSTHKMKTQVGSTIDCFEPIFRFLMQFWF